MVKVSVRVLLFCTGILAAGFGTAYFAGAFNPGHDPGANSASVNVAGVDPQTGQEPSNVSGSGISGNSSPAETDGSGAGNESGPEATVDIVEPENRSSLNAPGTEDTRAGAAGDVVVPAFDVLRVEPDGSMVVAGRAAGDAEVQVLSGTSVLATTQTSQSGDFAAVLDRALKPGEHNIVLRSTSPQSVATSVETAVVSIPSNEKGQVVALVQEPGEPSRLITSPEPETPNPSEAEKEARKSAAVSSDTGDASSSSDEAADKGALASSKQEANDPAQGGQEPDGDVAEEPDVEQRPEVAESPSDEIAEPAGAEESVAAGGSPDPASNAPEEGDVSPFIEAVEIDGREVFVAGRAEPGRRVRVYVNDILLGQTTVTPDGSFLIEAERDLPAGDYIIRADVLDDDGATVVARAAVPFQRPAGEKFSAVASDDVEEMSSGGGTGHFADMTAQRQDGSSSSPDTQFADAGTDDSSDTPATGSGEGPVADQVTLPALEPTVSAVIIRRGDTLWHISRRVYGQGLRYSTIYMANQEQIRDPDLIYPGQIFTLPEQTAEGEKADIKAIGEQAVSSDEAETGEVDS